MTTYESDIVLGDPYKDEQTGIEGICVALIFHQHACERAALEWRDGNDIKEGQFDAPRLRSLKSGEKVADSGEPGGPTRVSHKRG